MQDYTYTKMHNNIILKEITLGKNLETQGEDSAFFHTVLICNTPGQNATVANFTSNFFVYEVDRHDITLVLIITIELNLTF